MNAYFNKFMRICLFSALVIVSACSDSGTNNPVVTDKTAEIDRVCDSLIKATPGMTGIIVGVWDNDKNFTYTKGIGISDKAHNTPASADMLSRVGSITKTFTVTLALQMVDKGQLGLSDKVSKYFPEYTQLADVTVEMLCNMTSGIFDYTSDSTFATTLLSKATEYEAPTELIKIALKNSLLSAPGKEFHYSSSNTILLGMIIEKITGQKIENLIQNNIITPSGLTNTVLPTVIKMPTTNFLHGYLSGLDFGELADPSWAWAAGGIISNIYDLKKWANILVKGDLLSVELQNKRFTGLTDEDGNIYGLGITTIGNNLWGHSGTIPGYESIMMTDKAKDRTFVIFFNTYTNTASPEYLLKRILAIIG